MYGVTLRNNGSIISSSWERQIDWMDGTVFANSATVFVVSFFDFTNPKPANAIRKTFFMVDLVIELLKLYWLIKACH